MRSVWDAIQDMAATGCRAMDGGYARDKLREARRQMHRKGLGNLHRFRRRMAPDRINSKITPTHRNEMAQEF